MHKSEPDMILFFPQYQAGFMPSYIPIGTPALRALWQKHPDFAEVPLQPADAANPQTENNIRFRGVLAKQLHDAMEIVRRMKPGFIVTTGGDCGASFVPIATMNKVYNGKIGVIWVDAHADIHTPSTSPSGNYHGMVLRHLLGDVEFTIQPELPLRPQQIAYLGLRDTEKEEDAVIANLGIPHFSAAEVMKSNIPLDIVLDHFERNGITHLHLHVDCDVMDDKVFPHVHVPESDGLSLERLLQILQYLRGHMPMASCCLTEYAPSMPAAGLDTLKRIYIEGLGLELPA